MDRQQDKQALRESMRRARSAVGASEAADAGRRVALALEPFFLDLVGQHQTPIALLYAALPGEVDTAAIDGLCRRIGVAVAYPRVGEGKMLHPLLATPAELRNGRFAICEPTADATPVAPENIALVVVPGWAFDFAGHRLGFGGGYYDTFLARAAQAVRVGVCLPQQLVAKVPFEPHDEPMDYVVVDTVHATHARPIRSLTRAIP